MDALLPPKHKPHFQDALTDVSQRDFYAAVNAVAPSFIRVEADEATYNLHIMLRFELEQALIDGGLKAEDVPGVWNETFEKYLGLTPPDDTQGCLQDIHWSGGGIGLLSNLCTGQLVPPRNSLNKRARTWAIWTHNLPKGVI